SLSRVLSLLFSHVYVHPRDLHSFPTRRSSDLVGTVVKTTSFGAFVSLTPGKDGLLHISQIRRLVGGKRVDSVEDVLNVGDKVQVELAEIDQRGKLSLHAVVEDEEAGASADGESAPAGASPEDGSDGEGRREGGRRRRQRTRTRRGGDASDGGDAAATDA